MPDPYLLVWWLNEIAQPIAVTGGITIGIVVWIVKTIRGK